MPVPTIRSLNAAFENGSDSPAALTERLLDKARSEAARAVFVRITADRARTAARAAQQRLESGRRTGMLDGIPVTWKDVFDQSGETTRLGSLLTAENPPAAQDAPAAALLGNAGTVSIGRTNMTELAFSGLGLNPHFGTPPNPWSPPQHPLAPGGSSCGAAVSVAQGLCAFAMAADTSGSIRVPAALNGLAGFRPTSTRLTRIGVWPLAPTLDSIGPIAHTLEDICTVMRPLGVSAGAAPGAGSLKILIPSGLYGEDADESLLRVFEQAEGSLKKAGIAVERRPVPELDGLPELFGRLGTLVGLEAWQLHGHYTRHVGRMDSRVARRLLANAAHPPEHLAELLACRSRLQNALPRRLQGALLLMPATAVQAPPLPRLENDPDCFDRANAAILRNSMAGSFLDTPALTIPAGLTADGLPAALSLSAPAGSDETLLAAGLALARILTGDTPLNRLRPEDGGSKYSGQA